MRNEKGGRERRHARRFAHARCGDCPLPCAALLLRVLEGACNVLYRCSAPGASALVYDRFAVVSVANFMSTSIFVINLQQGFINSHSNAVTAFAQEAIGQAEPPTAESQNNSQLTASSH